MFAIGITFCWHVVSNAKEAPQEPVARPSYQQFKDDNLKNLMNDFPSQNSKQFWQVLRAAIKRILTEEDPKYPAILLFAIPKDPSASLTGSCLAHHLTHQLNVFHGLENKAFIDIDKDLTHKSAAGDKKELDEKLINLYGVRESKGVAVDHFEKLSPMASLLFHGYCDGDHAPYKNVSMVLVLHTDINQDNILTNKSAVDDFLQNLWAKELDGDKIPPLISRIANNVAIVTPEDEHSIRKLCPWL
ncbi:hypothetical protein KUTeg_022051 [Tegillarca granosa]|uniref:Torsin-1A-interacting protein 1/2 AAA+ activator domain-containing protein n=1 Tax=Tegillarca granosa TaxID=220873 RepID=A0ABQ9E5H0_TEGGR|nr:hypothetical protein KUTeg_022051 [Tegillarca granosa]